jgi:hypothetical protein
MQQHLPDGDETSVCTETDLTNQTKPMSITTDEINTTIAKACGWRWQKDYDPLRDGWWVNPNGEAHDFNLAPPNYCADLNAMHEAENIVTGDILTCLKYQRELTSVMGLWCFDSDTRYLWHATARQRAEAFMTTLGLGRAE